jgi:predicted short-subunit dehydrogenase-like oxidoreductase (DUF2520 family)
MLPLTINIIGAGLVGQVLGAFIAMNSSNKILGVLNRSIDSAREAIKIIGQGEAVDTINHLHPADIFFITTPDDSIQDLCNQLAKTDALRSGAIVIHCSGILTTSALDSAKLKGCHIARIHPIKHITSVKKAIQTFTGTNCVFEGSEAAYHTLSKLFTTIGVKLLYMQPQYDYQYHTACVFSTTFHQLIVAAAAMLYESCGIIRVEAMALAKELAISSLNYINSPDSYSNLVEGPIKRLDTDTLSKNLNSIKQEKVQKIFQAMSEFATNISNHPEHAKDSIYDFLRRS